MDLNFNPLIEALYRKNLGMRHGFKADPLCEVCAENTLLEEMRIVLMAEWDIPPDIRKEIYCRNCIWIPHNQIILEDF
jgi:hypothetical protein